VRAVQSFEMMGDFVLVELISLATTANSGLHEGD
jgi:hypothetical protein